MYTEEMGERHDAELFSCVWGEDLYEVKVLRGYEVNFGLK